MTFREAVTKLCDGLAEGCYINKDAWEEIKRYLYDYKQKEAVFSENASIPIEIASGIHTLMVVINRQGPYIEDCQFLNETQDVLVDFYDDWPPMWLDVTD